MVSDMGSTLPSGEAVPADGMLPSDALGGVGDHPFEVYLHVPFCRARCGYCDFNTYVAELAGLSTSDYLSAAEREIDLAGSVMPPGTVISTVFIGGGTPTLLTPAQLARLIAHLRDAWTLADDPEITVEANPETLDERILTALLEAGCTRLSLGMQSAVPHVLATLDRVHTPGRALDAVRWAHAAGFESVSVDLISGTPGESLDDWRRSLDAALSEGPEHLSAYSLIVEPGTALARRIRRGELPSPDDDDLAEKYVITEDTLVAAGMANYEVSNWSLPGHESRHNLGYWRGANWWGFGPGAHSHVNGVRWWNVLHPRAYAAALAEGRSPGAGRELLTAEQRRVERVLLELRLAEGLPLSVLTPTERGRVPGVIAAGLAIVRGDRLVLTLPGRLLADGVIRDLLD